MGFKVHEGWKVSADPIVYCLECLTDYDQFERLCHDMMALEGYSNIEPLGGSKDKGRDAIHIGKSTGIVSIFAYSVREDWRVKLGEDAEKIKKHGHKCDRLVFLCTASFTSTERDEAVKFVKDNFGVELELHGLERISSRLRSTQQHLVAQHPQIFTPQFFQFAGNLSLVSSPDHVVIDHVDTDCGLAMWLARRLTLAGFRVWCRGLSPFVGASPNDTIRSLVNCRAYRYIAILSPQAISDVEFTVRRNAALAVGAQRGAPILIPAIARELDLGLLDTETRELTPARFDAGWAIGLQQIASTLFAASHLRVREGANELAIRSYFPEEIVKTEPEILASNLFKITKIPEALLRFHSAKPLPDASDSLAAQWAHRKVSDTHFLSFHQPPPELAKEYGIVGKGGSVWKGLLEMDGINVSNLITELLKKSFLAECRRRGLLFCPDRNLVYFPSDLLKNDNLRFNRLDGRGTFFQVVGERTQGKGERAKKFRYYVAPVFVPMGDPDGGYELIVRIRVHITDIEGKLFAPRLAHSRRKKLCKSWFNEEWLNRVMGVMQFLAAGSECITIGSKDSEFIEADCFPKTYLAPVTLNEEALGDAKTIAEEEIICISDDSEGDEEEESSDD